MVCRQVSHLLVVGLIVLLGAQLTGLSCLQEWRLAFLAGGAFDTPQITGVAMGAGALADDGCPCHMAFVSILPSAHQVSHPVALIDLGVPVTAPLISPFSLFHPPLSL
jgi:hypothetical protein